MVVFFPVSSGLIIIDRIADQERSMEYNLMQVCYSSGAPKLGAHANGQKDGHTNGRAQPNLLFTCFAKATWSIIINP